MSEVKSTFSTAFHLYYCSGFILVIIIVLILVIMVVLVVSDVWFYCLGFLVHSSEGWFIKKKQVHA